MSKKSTYSFYIKEGICVAQKIQETKDAFSEGLKQLPYPAFGLDEKGTFVSRNKAANPRIFPIHLRTKIDRFLSGADQKRLEALQVGEEALIDVHFFGTHGTIVYRCRDGYWLAMRDLTTHLMACAQQNGKDIPPFFSAVEQQIRELQAKQEQFPEELHALRNNFQHMLRYHTEMTMYLHYTAEKQEQGGVCEVTSPLDGLITCAHKILHPNGFRPEIQFTEGPVYVCGGTDEIRYTAALMIACAAEHLRDRRHFAIHGRVLEEEYLFSVEFEPLLEGKLYQTALSGRFEEGLSSAFGTMFFQLLLLSRLANANGWRFSVVNAGNREGFLRMTLALPLTEQRPLLLNEIPDPLPLMKMTLSFLFPPEDRGSGFFPL